MTMPNKTFGAEEPMSSGSAPPLGQAGRAYVLLVLTTLIWGGNAVAGRLAVGQVSPMALTSIRWLVVCVILAVIGQERLKADWPILRPRLGWIALLGMSGYTGFNALFYSAAHYTGAVNLAILQGAIPMIVFLGVLAVYGTPIRATQIAGLVLTFVGIALVAAKGHPETLLNLDFNIGDLLMLTACLLYGGYTVGLRSRPPASDIGFFTIMAAAAFVTSLPLLAIEIALGQFQAPTPFGWLVAVWIGIFPSLLSQLFYMRGVAIIGPGRAGIFANLVPIFGAALAVMVLGEPFGWFHAVALCLVVGGIVWAQRG